MSAAAKVYPEAYWVDFDIYSVAGRKAFDITVRSTLPTTAAIDRTTVAKAMGLDRSPADVRAIFKRAVSASLKREVRAGRVVVEGRGAWCRYRRVV